MVFKGWLCDIFCWGKLQNNRHEASERWNSLQSETASEIPFEDKKRRIKGEGFHNKVFFRLQPRHENSHESLPFYSAYVFDNHDKKQINKINEKAKRRKKFGWIKSQRKEVLEHF